MSRNRLVWIVLAISLFHGRCPAASGPDRPALPPSVQETADPAAEPNGPLALRQALAMALARSPQLTVFPYDLRAADARILQAGLRPNPEVQIEVEEFGGEAERSGFGAAETTVQVGQPIELGGKRSQRKRVARLDRERLEWDYKAARLDVMHRCTLAFVAVLAAQERLGLTDRLLDLSRQAHAVVAQRVKAGKDSPVDEVRASVAFSESRIDRQKAEQSLAAARQGLAAIWGSRVPAFEKAVHDFYEVAAPRSLVEIAAPMADNPDLARWTTEEDRRRAILGLEKAQAVPDVTLGGGVRRFEQTDDMALVFGLSVPIPLANRNQGGIRAALEDIAKTGPQHEAARMEVWTSLSQAVAALTAAYQEISISREDVLPKARQAFEAAQQGHLQGKFDYLYVLDAQRTLFSTQARYVDSLETYHKAQADVDRLVGRPLVEGWDSPSNSGRPYPPRER